MEDGLCLSLSLSLKPSISESLEDSEPKEGTQASPNTTLNLGWMGGNSETRHEETGRGPTVISGSKRSAEREVVTISSSSDGGGGGDKKKLRLSKEQSTLLEHTFLEHSTLNNKQKLHLAKELNLKPRQVEVWFQNRRARTKLKQTEVDCEFLRKYCEKLCYENRRLLKELQEYKYESANSHVLCHACRRRTSTAFSRPAVKPNVSALFSNKTTTLLKI